MLIAGLTTLSGCCSLFDLLILNVADGGNVTAALKWLVFGVYVVNNFVGEIDFLPFVVLRTTNIVECGNCDSNNATAVARSSVQTTVEKLGNNIDQIDEVAIDDTVQEKGDGSLPKNIAENYNHDATKTSNNQPLQAPLIFFRHPMHLPATMKECNTRLLYCVLISVPRLVIGYWYHHCLFDYIMR